MTRAEQIEDAAVDSHEGDPDSSMDCCNHCFVKGAEWADANPDHLTYELADEMEMFRNKCEDLEHDHKIMREALEYYTNDPLSTYAREVLAMLRFNFSDAAIGKEEKG